MLPEVFNLDNYRWAIWGIPPLIGSVYFLFIGLFVYFKNRKSSLNLSFGLMCFVSAVWQLGAAMLFFSKMSFYPMFWNKFIGMGVVFIDFGFYLFAVTYTRTIAKYKTMTILLLLKSVIFFILVISTDLILTDLRIHPFGYYLSAGKLHPFFLSLFVLTLIAGLTIFIRFYKYQASQLEKQKMRYIMLGFAIYCLACVDYIPMYTNISIYPFGDIFVICFISMILYAIIRYRAMEIDTVIHRTFMWAITVSLLVVPFSMGIGLTVSWFSQIALLARVVVLTLILYGFLIHYRYLKPKIDHVFRRRKYDYYEVLAELGQKIGSELELKNVGSRIFRELKNVLYIRNGVLLVQQTSCGNYEEISSLKDKAPRRERAGEMPLQVNFNSLFSQYINKEQRVLEREQVDVDPQYEGIKKEATELMGQKEIEILIPTVLENKVNGMIGIGKKENLQTYTQKDIELLEKMGKQLGITIDNALHHGDIVEKERLAEELRLGQEIQRNLLPLTTPEVPGLKLAGLMVPAKEIGGDYYDYIVSNSGVGIAIGDVSGKGVGAGLIMATAKATLKGLSQQGLTPKEMLGQSNNIIHEYTHGEKFMTMLYFQWNSREKKMSYSSAGHEHILIYRSGKVVASGFVEVIQGGGFMMGIMPDIEDMLENRELVLQHGDKIILYTDGVTEAHNEQDEMYSLGRLTETVKQHGHKSCTELINCIKDDVYGFMGAAEQYDDITSVVMEAE